MNADANYKEEIYCFVRYLSGMQCTKELAVRYVDALKAHDLYKTEQGIDSELVKYSKLGSFYTAGLDCATTFLARNCAFRKRLYVACALIETTPEYANDFIHVKNSRLMALLKLFWNGLLYAFYVIAGLVIWTWISIKWKLS